jgi:hypothetical protein
MPPPLCSQIVLCCREAWHKILVYQMTYTYVTGVGDDVVHVTMLVVVTIITVAWLWYQGTPVGGIAVENSQV